MFIASLAFLVLTIFGLISFSIACITRQWKLAGAIVAFPFVAGGLLYFLDTDGYIRKPVPAAELIGTYKLDPTHPDTRLARMGYKDFSGQLVLEANGTFSGTQIPGCCVDGNTETDDTFFNGYYNISGTWSPYELSYEGVAQVELRISAWHVANPTTSRQPEKPAPDAAYTPLLLLLVNNKPIGVAFQIFNGDF